MNTLQKRLKKSYKKLVNLNLNNISEIDFINYPTFSHYQSAQWEKQHKKSVPYMADWNDEDKVYYL